MNEQHISIPPDHLQAGMEVETPDARWRAIVEERDQIGYALRWLNFDGRAPQKQMQPVWYDNSAVDFKFRLVT